MGKSGHISIVFTIECNSKNSSPSESVENFYLHNRGDYAQVNEQMERIDWNEELLRMRGLLEGCFSRITTL